MIGRCVAKDVHDGSHLLYPVQAGDRRTHHLSGCQQRENEQKADSEKVPDKSRILTSKIIVHSVLYKKEYMSLSNTEHKVITTPALLGP